jgi:hypothetical protein
MNPNTICFVDENDVQRGTYARALTDLFEGTDIVIKPMAPLAEPDQYAKLIADGSIAGFIIDQLMADGGIKYTGTELSGYLRAIKPKLPIVILSNHTDDAALLQDADAVEYVVAKKDLGDIAAKPAQIFKARFLRRLGGYNDLLGERTQRYQYLLVKSLKESLTSDEEKEMGLLEIDRALPLQANEINDVRALAALLDEMKKRLNPEEAP